MNNDDFVRILSEKTRLDIKDTERIISSVADIIVGELQNGNSVSFQGFGFFEVKKKMEKIVANNSTGKRILFPPRLIVGFKPSSLLKERIYSTVEK